MDIFIKRIAEKILTEYNWLSIVDDKDGILHDKDLQDLLHKCYAIEFVEGGNMALRIHFETVYKRDRNSQKYCYLCEDTASLLPDMTRNAHVTALSVNDLFANFGDLQALRRTSVGTLHALYLKKVKGNVDAAETRRLLREIENTQSKPSPNDLKAKLGNLNVDWRNAYASISKLSAIIADAIASGQYAAIETDISRINQDFQHYLEESYFGLLHSSHSLKAQSVNKVMPYLASRYGDEKRVAFVVIDGMTFWQYEILKRQLGGKGCVVEHEDAVFAWLPSITKLSRQALFRGDDPQLDYKQGPENERKLWAGYWTQRGVLAADIQYVYGEGNWSICPNTKRLALVNVELDKVMHSLTDVKDLHSVTESWCERMSEKLIQLKSAGFDVYVTTDHGNVMASGWRELTASEKVHLYSDGSRGKRHLIYKDKEEMNRFYAANCQSGLLQHDNWIVFQNDRCFQQKDKIMITHGGSHFLEVLVPFIKI